MSVGDINSEARGSCARFNTGKLPYQFLPVRAFACSLYYAAGHAGVILPSWLEGEGGFLATLDKWQRGEASAYDLLAHLERQDLHDTARVFEYGAQKYAGWNWAREMKWSVPYACILRHIESLVFDGPIDPESGLPHTGHIFCNVVMLTHFEDDYPEGDDRPNPTCFAQPENCFGSVILEPSQAESIKRDLAEAVKEEAGS